MEFGSKNWRYMELRTFALAISVATRIEKTLFDRRNLLLVGLIVALTCGVSLNAFTQNGMQRITVDPARRFQTMDGFGVNYNATYFRDSQRPMINQLVSDLGARIFRLDPYGLINWEAANDNDDPNVMNWEYYNDRYSIPEFEAAWAAGRYLNSLGIQPYLTLSGLPPAWMLDENANAPSHSTCSKDIKGHLNRKMYAEYAETVVSLALYARNTAHLDYQYFGPVNETDCYPSEGPRIDPDEMPSLLAIVAERLKKEGLGDVKIVAAEQAHMENNYIEQMLKNKELMPSIGAFSLHTYEDTKDASAHVRAVSQSAYPNVPVWLTEYGDLDDLDQSAENEWKGFSVRATRRALRALNQGVTAVLYWDAFDNYHEHYPRFTHYGLFAEHNHAYAPKKRYYAAKQLYHFVHPGAERIQVESTPDGSIAGFLNSDDGSIVIVGVQEGGSGRLAITLPGYEGQWQVYQTTPRLNCQLTGTSKTTRGSAEISLASDSIFTLVLVPKPRE